ncbi:MAG: DUF3047 domain-containing protein [Burkholderiaceae bacterium]
MRRWFATGQCRLFQSWSLLVVIVILTGCAVTIEPVSSPAPNPSATQITFEGWTHKPLPGKRPTRYQVTELEGRPVVRADADAAVSLFRRALRVEPDQLGSIEFAWRVQALLDNADLTQRSGEDSPVRLLLAFEGDRSTFTSRNRMLSDLSQTLTGEPLPYATLMYVWDNKAQVGAVIPVGSGTDRIRKLVLDSGPALAKTWRNHVRDIAADYRLVFGEEPGALVAVALMTDSDNTRTRAQGWYGPVRIVDNKGLPR